MLIEENIRIAATQLRAGKMRSFLTTLGITIGVGTVIFIVSILEGYNQSITSELNILGANTFQVQRNERFTGIGHSREKQKYRKIMKWEVAEAIRANSDLVEAVGAEVWDFGLVVGYKDKKTNPNMQVAGGEPEFFVNNGYFTSTGRIFTPEDINLHRKVIVLGMDAVDVLFPQEDPMGKEVKLVGTKFEVVGVLEKKGSATFGQSQDNLVIIPISTFEDLWGKFRSVNITVRVKEGVDFEDAQSQVIGIVRKERGVPPGEENDFTIFSNDTLIEEFDNIAGKVTLVGVLLGAISLLVGSIGVMNIMLVTVTERTREIGIRKAVGAKKAVILTQFLIEAIALSLIGGIVGMMLGFGLAAVIGMSLKIPFAVPMWVVFTSIGVTSFVGLAAGMYPAARAAKLDPINALRYE